MRRDRVSLSAFRAAALVATGPQVAAAGQERTPPPAAGATDVQKLSDELARLKREFETLRRQYDEQ